MTRISYISDNHRYGYPYKVDLGFDSWLLEDEHERRHFNRALYYLKNDGFAYRYSEPQVHEMHSAYHERFCRHMEKVLDWCDENCKGDWGYKIGNLFCFENENDIILFKLRWA